MTILKQDMMISATVRLFSVFLESPHRTIVKIRIKTPITTNDEIMETKNPGHFKQKLNRK